LDLLLLFPSLPSPRQRKGREGNSRSREGEEKSEEERQGRGKKDEKQVRVLEERNGHGRQRDGKNQREGRNVLPQIFLNLGPAIGLPQCLYSNILDSLYTYKRQIKAKTCLTA